MFPRHCGQKWHQSLLVFRFLQVGVLIYDPVNSYFFLNCYKSVNYDRNMWFVVENMKIWIFRGDWDEYRVKKSILAKNCCFWPFLRTLNHQKSRLANPEVLLRMTRTWYVVTFLSVLYWSREHNVLNFSNIGLKIAKNWRNTPKIEIQIPGCS